MKPISKKLRARAEKLLAKTPREVAQMPADDVQKLVHELQVHQIELEMQNDELRRTQLELEAARERLRLPYDAAPVGFLTLDVRGVIQEANLAAARLLNFDRVKLPGQKLTHFIAPESQDVFYFHRRRLLHTGEKQTSEIHFLRTGQPQFIARLETVVDRTGPEPGTHCLVMMSDITEQKRAEEIIRDQEVQLRLITDTTPVMLTRCSRDLHYRFVNRAYAEMLGLTPEQIVGEPIVEIMGAEGFEAIRPHVENVLQGQRVEYEHLVPFARVGPRFLRVAYTPDADDHGEVRGWVASISDITERKHAEAALRESEARFGQMADAAPVLIWISGPDKLCTYFNKPWLEFTGRALEQELGNGWAEGVHPDDLPRCLKIYVESFDARREFRMEYRLKRHDGEYRWILDHGIPRFAAEQEFLGYIGSCVDINERKQAEEALQRARDELEQRVQERTTELNWTNNALRGEKAFSDSLIELAPALVAMVDGQGNLIRTNAHAEQLTGYPFAETQGRNMIALFVPKPERPRVRRLLREVLRGRAVPEMVAPLRTRDGGIRQIEWFTKPITNADGKLSAVLAIGHDVTERLQMQQALQTSETKFRGFVESAPDGIAVVNEAGRIVLVNAQVKRLFGYRPAELSGQPLDRLLPERFRKRHAGHFQGFFAAPRSRPMGTGLELSARRKDGSEFPVEIMLSPVSTEEGLVVFSAIRDITERKEAEESLRRNELHLTNFFNQAPIGLVWLSASGTILRANQAQLDMLGCKARDFLGHSFNEFVAEPSHGYELLKWLAAQETVRNLRMPLRSRNGALRHVLVDANSFWKDNQFQYSSIFLRDITDRIHMEREILHISEREHRRIAQDLHDGLGQLLVGAAYLAGTVRQDLAAKSLPETRKLNRILDVINEAVEQTRTLARGLHPVEQEPNSLMVALESLAARTKKLFQVRCRFSCRQPVLAKDNVVATHLYRIAQEAVTNAIKHGKPGRIEISLTETPGRIILAVRDDGSGMPVRQRKKAGMGLRIMRYRAGVIGGSLAIQKEAGGGTAVVCTVHLPDNGTRTRGPGGVQQEKVWERSNMAKRIAASPLTEGRKNIVIVDDHPTTREGLRAVINREPDLMVCGEAENARQAVDAVTKLAPDLVLVDITMPGKSGLELVKDLKALHPQLAILALSMHDELLYAERMLRAGAGGYITKQQPPEELVKAIRQVLDRHFYLSRDASERLLQRFSGQPRANQSAAELLTDREFEIFTLIGQGKVPKEIARQLHLSTKTVAVHYANIRRKLNIKSTARLIRFAVQSEDSKPGGK